MPPPRRIDAPSPAVTDELLRHSRWHRLFDTLCSRAGHFDNAALASAYCRRVGRNGEVNFEAMQKNLRHWRGGQRLPLRRNVVVLAELLGLASGSDLHRHWMRLYAFERGEELAPGRVPESNSDGQDGLDPVPAIDAVDRAWRLAAIAGTIGCLGFISVTAVERWQFQRLPLVNYTPRVTMSVGDTRLIHGLRGDCNSSPPDWYYTRTLVPPSRLGVFTDGGVARRDSVSCQQMVPVRAARFQAHRPGMEQVKLMGDLVTIEVAAGAASKQD